MKGTFYFIGLSLLFGVARGGAAYGQKQGQARIDSLLQALPLVKTDTDRVNLLNHLGNQYYRVSRYDSALYCVQNAEELAEKSGFKSGIITARSITAIVYFDLGNYPVAMKKNLAALKLCEEVGNKNGIATIYNNIGNIYRNQHDNDAALENHFAALKIREELGNKGGVAMSYINIATIYRDKGDYAEALKKNFAALAICEAIEDKRGISISYNNTGNIYIDMGDYEKALQMHLAVWNISREQDKKGDEALACYNIGNTYNKMNNPTEAKKWLKRGLELGEETGMASSIQAAYSGLAISDSLLKNYRSSLENYKMFIVYRDSLFNEENLKKIIQAGVQYEFDKKSALAKAEQEKKIATTRLQFGIFSLIIFLVALMGFSLFYITRLRKKKERQILLANQQITELEKQKLEAELEQAQEHVQQFLKQLNTKNELIDKVSLELEKLNDQYVQEKGALDHTLSALRDARILTDDDWSSFLSGFNRLYPRFAMIIKDQYPGITLSELRYLMLTKIGMTHKEMAGMLGVSFDTIRVTWNRVRKKLDGSLEDTPQSLLHMIETASSLANYSAN